MLAAHVVRTGRDRAEGWPAQHEFERAEAQEVGQIGLAAGELAHGKRAFCALQTGAQVGFEPAGIETLVGALVDQFGRLERWLHQHTASFETALRASSGWGKPMMGLRNNLILRSPRSGRLEGCSEAIQLTSAIPPAPQRACGPRPARRRCA